MTRHSLWLALALTAAAGCAPADEDDLASVATGIYRIDGRTLNDGGCVDEGPSILEGTVPTHVAIAHVASDYEELIEMHMCGQSRDCSSVLDDSISPYGTLDGGNLEDGFDWHLAGTRAVFDEYCMPFDEHATLTFDGAAARYERRLHFVERPLTDIFCLGVERPANLPCREFEVLTLTREADLP